MRAILNGTFLMPTNDLTLVYQLWAAFNRSCLQLLISLLMTVGRLVLTLFSGSSLFTFTCINDCQVFYKHK